MAADLLVPARPVTTALQRNVPGLAPAAVASDPDRQSRNVVWRVRMAEQTLAITAAHPQGTGVGSFPAVIHRYQRYPMLWSNSAHNFYLETLATGGPLRLLLLLAILGTAVVAGWRTERWPVALGVAGYWVTLAFDVGNLSPGFMAVGFWGLGYLLAKPAELPAWSRPRAIPGWLGVVVGVVAVAWWYLPCDHTDCALDRHLAFPRSVTQGFGQISEAEQDRVLAEAAKRYPESFWVATLTLRFAGSPERQLAAARDVAVRFPFQHPDRYLDWADFAHEAGDVAEERAALKQGLAIFYEDAWVARGRRLTGGGYLRRVERMRTQLAALKGD